MVSVDKLNPADTRPPVAQVAQRVREQLRAETYGVGDKLPTHEAMSDEFGVSVNTIKRALGFLQEEGLIVSRRGQGAFVRVSGNDVPEDDPSESNGRTIDDLYGQLAAILERLDVIERELKRRH
ncbi:GntR family transcriptional regulator [Amycolatopsis suaedae]|uniref:GntR family transcriptional regulator n=1 Tax=Amycolatopsis suaedae TaxID=2510978 RepID=A0A4Q7J9G7_9PSEU|nr:GntR family transcriptional regulator [Amycolatopsis suaedae]